MDWTGCDLVEQVPGKVSGQPVVKGTRILADSIIEDAALGSPVEEIAENYPSLPIEKIRKLIALAAHARDPLIRLQPLSSCGYPGKTWYFAGASRRQSFVPGGTGHAYRSRAKCTGSKLDAHTDVFFFSW